MHHSGPLPLSFESPEQCFEGKNCQNVSQGKPCQLMPCTKVLRGMSVVICRTVDMVSSVDRASDLQAVGSNRLHFTEFF